jgi:hypothetical protein
MTPSFSDHRSPGEPAGAAGSVSEVSLLRLAQSLVELTPKLAMDLSLAGLENLKDPAERESWQARLAPMLDNGASSGGGPMLSA